MKYDHKAYQAAWYQKNKEKKEEQRRARNKANPEKHRQSVARWRANNAGYVKDLWLRQNYGITLEQRNKILESQGNRCAVCRTDEPAGRWNEWHTDHCHATGRVRGILCMRCNIAVGQFFADADYDRDERVLADLVARRANEGEAAEPKEEMGAAS
jgi:hypothetical protein